MLIKNKKTNKKPDLPPFDNGKDAPHWFLQGVFAVLKGFTYLIWTLLMAAFLVIVVFLIWTAPQWRDGLKLYFSLSEGKYFLTQSFNALNEKEYTLAGEQAGLAGQAWGRSYQIVEDFELPKLKFLENYRQVALSGLKSLNHLTNALSLGTNFFADLYLGYENYQEVSFNHIPTEDRRALLEKLSNSPTTILQIRDHINLALLSMYQIDEERFFGSWGEYLKTLKSKLLEANDILNFAYQAARVLPSLAGYPAEKQYLFLLQNPWELRPTGGFIGTYGILKMKDGEIAEFKTHDVYSLDNPATDAGFKATPPQPIKDYLVDNYFFRDANWSPDFPTSAHTLLRFYEDEKKIVGEKPQNFDGVIAITPRLIENLLLLLGGLELAGEKYSADNFTELLQYKVEVDWHQQGLQVDERKNVVADIALSLKERLFALPLRDLQAVILLVIDLLNEKEILMFFKDPLVMDIVRNNDWTGEIKSVNGDYLMVVDTNLASLKTDEVMEKDLSYRLVEKDGKLLATAAMTYKNTGTFTWKHTRLNSFTRFYVPQGSKLISSSGQMKKDRSKEIGKVETGEEFGKTVFGAFISIEPGQTKTLTLTYELPDYVYQQYLAGQYSLLIQKQPGTTNGLLVELPNTDIGRLFKPMTLLVNNEASNSKYLYQAILSEDFEGAMVR
ncbi:MAG TPA: DUF4012 domain-containing protein [bacterium]|nr:DUF4012 domain-containing protein [bacterium]